jgi:hypothetical protein
VVAIRGAQYADIHEALALLALDIAELRYGGYKLPPLKSSKLSSAVDHLGLTLEENGLMGDVPILPYAPFPPQSMLPESAL